MKRSELNSHLRNAVAFMKEHKFALPPFAFWTPEQWKEKGAECDEIRDACLGWDVTDFGSGDFFKKGLLLFTLRNGSITDKRYTKPYAEKIMVVEEKQVTPFHFHHYKQEDIINRGGGKLLIKLYNSAEDETFADTPVTVCVDGEKRILPAGSVVTLSEGESITLTKGLYHTFWAENGKVLAGEVSMTNDDFTDNRFLEETGRFPEVEEDEKPLYLLATEYYKIKLIGGKFQR